MEKITIYHTNDMHSHLTYWPRIARYLSDEKQKKRSENETVFVFDSGDATDRMHPLTEATDGKAIASLLHDGNYDAITIGNNEGIGNTKDQLNNLFTESEYKVVVSNLLDKETGSRPAWAEELIILETAAKKKIALIGCTIPLQLSYDSLGWDVLDPIETITHMIQEHKDEVDGFILLSHLGLDTDREIASLFPEILVILGGHTHHLLPEGEKVNNTLIAGAGKFGRHIGIVTIELLEAYKGQMSAQVIDVRTQLDEEPDEQNRMEELKSTGKLLLEEESLGVLTYPLEKKWTNQTNLISLTLEAMREASNGDGAIINAGLFLKSIPKGTTNRRQLHEALPHPMRLVEIILTGHKVIEMLKQMENQQDKLKTLSVKGYGFRGDVFGELIYQGIQIKNNEVIIDNNHIILDRLYKIITVDYLMYVPYFPVLQEETQVKIISSDFLRTIVGNYVKKQYPAHG
ncbi:MAG: bifunctional metallophosphatase/5'-nucleotidase [Alkalibacterium sp.]|nr:bifunctional metallophosphatase/5'-nucleotidase [Alkalibacterium sp.]